VTQPQENIPNPRTFSPSSIPARTHATWPTLRKESPLRAIVRNASLRQSHQLQQQQPQRKPQPIQPSVEAGLATTRLALVLLTPKKNKKLLPKPQKNLPSFQLELAPLATAVGEIPHATQTLAPLILVTMATLACGHNP